MDDVLEQQGARGGPSGGGGSSEDVRVEEILSRLIGHLGEVRRVGRDFLQVLKRGETDMDRSTGKGGRRRRRRSILCSKTEVDLACNVDPLDLLVAEDDIDRFVDVCAQTGLVRGGGGGERRCGVEVDRRGHRTADPDGGRIKGIVGSDG